VKYQVWMEGFMITGMEGEPARAHLLGEYEADSFKEACIKACGKSSSFNEERLTEWGCKLYDNERDARKTFG